MRPNMLHGTRSVARRQAMYRPTASLRLPAAPSHPLPQTLRLARLNSSSSRPPLSDRPKPEPGRDASATSSPADESFGRKLSRAWRTPTKWYSIPVGLGALVLLAVKLRKDARDDLEVESETREGAVVRSKRKVDGPWQVRVLGALPLRSLSQLWGYLNSLVLPVWFRPFGFKLYATIFGCDLDEVPLDLREYDSLGEFFYREMKEGLRPIADAPMVSPADGRVLHFGEILESRVEQVKGLTYSLSALLGSETEAHGERTEVPRRPSLSRSNTGSSTSSSSASSSSTPPTKGEVVHDEQFAEINDIPYSLSSLLGHSKAHAVSDPHLANPPKNGAEHDASHPPSGQDLTHDASVALSLGTKAASKATDKGTELALLNPDKNRLYFCVIYLAPGDYHRFHSPATWVVERRRHFTGDLFSVSPYIANRLKDLFVLNERVALLGRWKHGFFSMVPVGATNVGSIKINFDEALRTNTRHMSHPPHTYTEAVYTSASTVLQGQPLLAGEEMGGFKLGSTIVLVFEAPKEWKFTVEAGVKVKVGEALGAVAEKDDKRKA